MPPYANREKDPITLASVVATALTPVNESAVAGFGAFKHLLLFLDVTAVSITAGTTPTETLEVWIQHTPDDGTTWDDVLAFKTSAMSDAGTEQHIGEISMNNGTPAAPAAIQTGGGSPAFAQRGNGYISDDLRVAYDLTEAGAPSARSVTFTVTAVGRP